MNWGEKYLYPKWLKKCLMEGGWGGWGRHLQKEGATVMTNNHIKGPRHPIVTCHFQRENCNRQPAIGC